MKTKLKSLIAQGEGINIEFKESKNKINRDVYETICAFLNRNGGHLFLGVRDNGEIIGVDEESVEGMKKDFFTAINNPQKLTPPFYLNAEVVEIDAKKIIYVFVPCSSSVHSVSGKIFDRNGDGDFNITGRDAQVAHLYLLKQTTYTENRVFPYVAMDGLKSELIRKVRVMASNRRKGTHPWEGMSDIEFLKTAGLYGVDSSTGKEGLRLSAILLFGKERTLLDVLPHYRTDAILRQVNLDRYDDRDLICLNLIESFERLMEFIGKHLNDPFFLEGQVSISLRDKIFREAIVNSLIHREYSNAYVAKMIIGKDRVVFENANRPHNYGEIDPNNFEPFPKNPTISKIFREIGFADELGSGVKNMYKYSKLYGGSDPKLVEEDIFRTIVLLENATEQVTPQATPQVTPQATPQADRVKRILEYCIEAKSRQEIQEYIGIQDRKYFRTAILNPMIEDEQLELTDKENPNSPKQKYITKK